MYTTLSLPSLKTNQDTPKRIVSLGDYRTTFCSTFLKFYWSTFRGQFELLPFLKLTLGNDPSPEKWCTRETMFFPFGFRQIFRCESELLSFRVGKTTSKIWIIKENISTYISTCRSLLAHNFDSPNLGVLLYVSLSVLNLSNGNAPKKWGPSVAPLAGYSNRGHPDSQPSDLANYIKLS